MGHPTIAIKHTVKQSQTFRKTKTNDVVGEYVGYVTDFGQSKKKVVLVSFYLNNVFELVLFFQIYN